MTTTVGASGQALNDIVRSLLARGGRYTEGAIRPIREVVSDGEGADFS